MDETITFAEWLKNKMKDKCLTPARISKITGINDGNLSRHLSGDTTPTAKSLQRYAAALEISIDELYRIVGYYDREEGKPFNRRNELLKLYSRLSKDNKRKLVMIAKNMIDNQ